MKRSLALILACILVFSALMILASCGSDKKQEGNERLSDGTFEWIETETGVSIRNYIGTGGAVEIPAELGGKAVTEINPGSFRSKTEITSVVIPDSVTRINGSAFEGCTSLTEVKIGKSVESIQSSAFEGCTALKSLTVCSSLTLYTVPSVDTFKTQITDLTLAEGITELSYANFKGWTALKTVNFNGNITRITISAFEDCTNLKSVTLPSGLAEIGDKAFFNSGVEKLMIPASVTKIGIGLGSCSVLEVEAGNTVYHSSGNCIIETESKTLVAGCKGSVIPSDGSVKKIGNYAFSDCVDLTKLLIPSSVTEIGKDAFVSCAGLDTVTIPTSVTEIGEYAFMDCTGLKSVTIQGNVTIINKGMFNNCSSLSQVSLPGSVTEIGYAAFNKCPSLSYVSADWSKITIDPGFNDDLLRVKR